ncbi:MAG: carbohydrate kinase, partial [Pseudomonadales bacterium]|nr:carbohydrate kinase [Pseudomonadales bacterium]
STMTKKYIEVIKWLPPFPSVIPGSYHTEVQIFRGFWMVNWFKREFCEKEQKIAEQKGVPVETLFEEMIKDIPPGAMGLTLQPYWTPGIHFPGPDAKGAIIGFGDVHTKAHIYRAILEGLAYALREGKTKTEKRTGTKLKLLRVSGGGSQSDTAMQITADIFGLPVERPHTYETSGLGAAIAVAVGLGFYSDFESAISAMTRVGDRFEPRPEAMALYNKLYHQVYRKMYGRLAPLYIRIREITGYPKI